MAKRDKYLVWDFTDPKVSAPSHIIILKYTETGDCPKYTEIASSRQYIFPDCRQDARLLGSICHPDLCRYRNPNLSGDPRSTAFLKQRLAVAAQRGNAAAC